MSTGEQEWAVAWAEQAKARITALWRARHHCIDARNKVHYWVRVLRIAQARIAPEGCCGHKRRMFCERN